MFDLTATAKEIMDGKNLDFTGRQETNMEKHRRLTWDVVHGATPEMLGAIVCSSDRHTVLDPNHGPFTAAHLSPIYQLRNMAYHVLDAEVRQLEIEQMKIRRQEQKKQESIGTNA